MVASFYIILYYVGLSIPLSIISFALTSAIFISVTSLILGGIGVQELSFTGLLIWLSGANSEYVTLGVITFRVFMYYLVVIVGRILLVLHKPLAHFHNIKTGSSED